MKKIILVFAATLAVSLFLGHRLGRSRGESSVARQLAARAASDSAAATQPKPPPAGLASGVARPGAPRSRAELSALLDKLKSTMLKTSVGGGGFNVGYSDADLGSDLDTLTLEEIKPALELAGELKPGMERSGLTMLLLGRWARLDPAAAFAHARSHVDKSSPLGAMWLQSVFPIWAEKDPKAAARALADTLKSETDEMTLGMSGNTVFMVAEKLSHSDLPAAMQHVATLPASVRLQAVTAIAKQAHEAGKQKFFDAIAALPKGPDKTAWQHAAATALAPVDAAAAAAYIDSLGLDQEDTRQATRAVFEKWKTHDPRSATAWAMSRLPAPEKEVLIDHAVQSWARSEPNECARWLGEFPAGDPLLDHAIATFAKAVAKKDPESAREWAARITAGPLREKTLGSLPPAGK